MVEALSAQKFTTYDMAPAQRNNLTATRPVVSFKAFHKNRGRISSFRIMEPQDSIAPRDLRTFPLLVGGGLVPSTKGPAMAQGWDFLTAEGRGRGREGGAS